MPYLFQLSSVQSMMSDEQDVAPNQRSLEICTGDSNITASGEVVSQSQNNHRHRTHESSKLKDDSKTSKSKATDAKMKQLATNDICYRITLAINVVLFYIAICSLILGAMIDSYRDKYDTDTDENRECFDADFPNVEKFLIVAILNLIFTSGMITVAIIQGAKIEKLKKKVLNDDHDKLKIKQKSEYPHVHFCGSKKYLGIVNGCVNCIYYLAFIVCVIMSIFLLTSISFFEKNFNVLVSYSFFFFDCSDEAIDKAEDIVNDIVIIWLVMIVICVVATINAVVCGDYYLCNVLCANIINSSMQN